MQDRYTGDIGDFGKLGMLRHLARIGLSVGVNWYLVPDEHHNGDGRHTGYLQNAAYSRCDEALWRALKELVAADRRSVAALEAAGLLPAVYHAATLDLVGLPKQEREAIRARWHAAALERLRHCDIVFTDPDNGLIVPSAQGTARAGKYILPAELADYYRQGSSVIYYQHRARRPDAFYLDQHERLLRSGRFPQGSGLGLKFLTTSQRYYFFLIQPRHSGLIQRSISRMMEAGWNQHFERIL